MKKGHFCRQCTKDNKVLFCKSCKVKGFHEEGSWLCPNYTYERRSRQNSGDSSRSRSGSRSQSPRSNKWSRNDRRRSGDRPKSPVVNMKKVSECEEATDDENKVVVEALLPKSERKNI